MPHISRCILDLREGSIDACLGAFGDDDVETVIHRILERRTLSFMVEESPISNRRNIFDIDEFDVFSDRTLDPARVD
ncbi:9347_t:CDS:2, partial [Paraglomus brasilianum]